MEKRGCKYFVRLCTLLLVVALLCAVGVAALAADVGTENEPVCYTHGDVNGDGVIDNRDAIYTLYHFMYGDEQYPVEQDWDFNSDGEHSNRDAIYVLYASLYEDDPDYQLKGFVHSYYDPAWEWAEEDGEIVANVVFKCGCGEDHAFTTEEGGVSVSSEEEKAATCLEAGVVKYVASIEFDGKEYTNTKTESIPTLRHDMDGFQNCENGAKCKNCTYSLPALGHNWVEKSRTEASCTQRAVITYVCDTCRITRNEETGEFAEHVMEYMDGCDVAEGCKYTQQYKCKNCPLTTDGTVYYQHNYVAHIVPATCVANGSKTYACDKCQESEKDAEGNVKTEVLVNAEAHNWVETAPDSGIFNCSNGCGETKKTVNAVDTAVSKDDLADVDEMKLSDDGAAMAVDEDTLEKLNVTQTIQITVSAVDVAESGLSAEQQLQVPGGTVYDFEMKIDNTEVKEFDTPITISLPYTPQEGEDLDAIDVWYIDDDGNVQSFQGVYSNGFVTFTTDHFSYYTVTRMTPKERCERYGHIWATTHKDATCTEDGFDLVQCQRCGEKDSDKKLEKTGHDYKETVNAATCTEEGAITKLCQNEGCKSYLIEKLPALGHKMQLNTELSAEATCEATGKEVHTCTREGCDKKTETVLAQLTHSFKLYDEKAPDCVDKGYRKNQCEHCGQIVTESETAPTGHEYLPENAVWNWSEDHKSATVTLVCSHDSGHTKTLTAVVSSVTKSETSCLGSGAVVYTAVAQFNKAEFTNTVTVTQAATGHKPGSSWSKDETNHWHICSACGENVDVTFHTWNEGQIITAPTCAEAGETLQTCTACGQERTVTVKATGAHDYHYGVCKNCGFGKSTCTHEAIHQLPADMSQFGLCEGAVFFWITCDCGENKTLVFDTIECNLGEPEIREMTDAYGQKYQVEVFTCPDCGLIGESYGYTAIVEGACRAKWTDGVRLIKDGQVLFVEEYVSEFEVYEHPTVIEGKVTDLSQYGVCGLTLVETVCPCGQNGGMLIDTCEGCDFAFNEYGQFCTQCGAEIQHYMEQVETDAPCTVIYESTFEVYMDGQKIFGTEWTTEQLDHMETMLDYEMVGTSCEEGIVLELQCEKCGETRTLKTNTHVTVISEEIDISGADICTDTLVQAVCPCGARKESYQTGDNFCEWMYFGMPEDGEPEYRECMNCGASQTLTFAYSEKNEWCDCVVYVTNTYRDKAGNQIAVTYDVYDTVHHNIDRTATLLGDNCEDGVLIVEECKDCGHRDEREERWHYGIEKATFDLSAFDMCATKGMLVGCLCGEHESFDWFGGYCHWTHIDGSMNSETMKCMECGIVMKRTFQMSKAVDACHTLGYVTLEFSRDGVSLGKFSFEQMTTNHFMVAQLELLNSEAGCAGGVRGTETCIVCGQSSSFEFYPEGEEHPVFTIGLEILAEEGLCGTLTNVTSSCACGKEGWTGESWNGNGCQFEQQRYSEELGEWVTVCINCGAERLQKREETRVEGTTCTVQAVQNVWLYKDGELLCQYDATYTYEEHRNIATFEMLGATCEDGYIVHNVCAFCGETSINGEPRFGCEDRTVDIVKVFENENVCQDVYVEKASCACGLIASVHITDWNCNFAHLGYDEVTGKETWRCSNCGLEKVGNERIETTSGSCDAQRILDYTYSLNGEVLGSITSGYDVKHHNMRYNFFMQGQSCEDGFQVSEQCVNCGYSRTCEGMHYGHEWFNLYREELSLYGLCGGEVGIHGCACGQEGSWYYSDHCRWESTGNTDPDTGLREQYCADCNTYVYFGTVGQVDQNCVYSGNLIFKASRDGQVLLDVCEPIREYHHTYQLVGANFDTEDRDCSSGVTVLRGCAVCGDTNEDHIFYHEDFVEDMIDLSAAGFACGGELRIGGCPCGQSDYFHWDVRCNNMTYQESDVTGPDGITRRQIIRECADCGLKLVEQSYSQKVEGCDYIRYRTVDIYKDGQIIKTMHSENEQKEHTPGKSTYSLAEGSTNCEDGVIVRWSCEICGEENEGYSAYHGMNATNDIIDLTPYGSICGAKLQRYACPCGQKQEYRFSEDCKCDITAYRDTLWIADAVSGDQSNVDGVVWLESYAERVGCGVTNPDPCGLELYKATYWTVQNCIATQYESWRMGYNAATNTWDKEITIPTGEQEAWHNYQHTTNDQRVNGTGTHTWGEECADCGSFREVIETWDNNQLKKRTEETVNNLNFGQNRRRYIVDDNGQHVQSKINPDESFWMASESEHTWTRMNGDVFQEGWTRTYDFSGYCKCSTTYWNSNGDTWSEQDEHAHTIHMEWEVGTQATCTQFGEWVRPCLICGYITEWERTPMDPTMHNFQWDSVKEKYVCSVCDLESVRGYSGSIAMEELSDATGADYVIGYWNRDEIEFMPTVSVMLYDVSADELDELVLTGIEFTYHTVDKDGFTGLSFNKAAAQAAADAAIAEAGYSGSYGIRISFVPLNTQDELDYAITFDTQTTAE